MDRRLLFTLVISCLGYTNALDCLGETCITGQYCQIQFHLQTAFCYTHHGHGHHEDHQKCIGAHHPADHCFCLEQACVDDIARRFTTAPTMPTTVPVVTAMPTAVPVVTAMSTTVTARRLTTTPVMPTTVPVVTAMPTTVPVVTAMPTTVPVVTAMPTTVPVVTAMPTTVPVVTAMPTTVPVVTTMQTTVHVVTAMPTTVHVVTSIPTTVTAKPAVHIEAIPCFGATCYTPSSCSVHFENGVPVSGKCVAMVSTACGPLPTTGNCECDSKFCMGLMYTLTTQAAASPKPTVHIEAIPCFGATCYTPSSCSVHFENGVPVSGKCVAMVGTACGPLPTTGNCECDSKLCMSLMYSFTTQAATPQSTVASTMAAQTTTTSMGPTTSMGTTPTVTCADNEDNLFNCQSYNDLYGMCTSSSSTLQNIAHTRCPKFCKICGSGIAPTKATLTGSVTQPTCIDHDQRCLQSTFQSILCKSTNPDTKKFAIATCPKSCNLCQEYIDSLLEPVTCNICGDLDDFIPCSNREISSNVTTAKCPSNKRFCMTDLYQDAKGNKDIFKRCVDENTCNTKWINESADEDYCTKYGTVLNPSQFQCHFCCTGDRCNTDTLPPASTLVAKATGK